MKKITIILNNNPSTTISFVGKYRRDLEKQNWHYYEAIDGELLYIRKEYMCAVVIDEDIDEEEE